MKIVIGDTHGNHRLIIHRVKSLDIKDTTLFHVGDFGIGFKPEINDKHDVLSLNKFLRLRNVHLYVCRGNHDNPYYFDGSWDFSNVHLVPDYTVVTIDGDDILMVGGATSIDRMGRRRDMQLLASQGKDRELYWYDEQFVLDEDKLKDVKGVRYVITHSCPHFSEPHNDFTNKHNSHGPFVEGFCYDDKTLKDELNKERMGLTKMYEILKENNLIEKWYYGHFHMSYLTVYDGTDFVMLNIDEFKEIK